MRFLIDGTDEVRHLEYNGYFGGQLTAESMMREGAELVYDRKREVHIISLRDYARWSRLIERLEKAEANMAAVIQRTRTRKNSEAINEIIESETEFIEGIEELPGAYEKIADRIEEEIALPLFSRRRPMSGTVRKGKAANGQ